MADAHLEENSVKSDVFRVPTSHIGVTTIGVPSRAQANGRDHRRSSGCVCIRKSADGWLGLITGGNDLIDNTTLTENEPTNRVNDVAGTFTT
jgi:hypothetical protein